MTDLFCLQDKYSEGYSDGTLVSTGQKFFSCSPGHGFYCPVAELLPDTGSREYCRFGGLGCMV